MRRVKRQGNLARKLEILGLRDYLTSD